jgi:hypothetical protein
VRSHRPHVSSVPCCVSACDACGVASSPSASPSSRSTRHPSVLSAAAKLHQCCHSLPKCHAVWCHVCPVCRCATRRCTQRCCLLQPSCTCAALLCMCHASSCCVVSRVQVRYQEVHPAVLSAAAKLYLRCPSLHVSCFFLTLLCGVLYAVALPGGAPGSVVGCCQAVTMLCTSNQMCHAVPTDK